MAVKAHVYRATRPLVAKPALLPVDGNDGVAAPVNGVPKSRGFLVLGYRFLPISPV